jgi:hypothetical protein
LAGPVPIGNIGPSIGGGVSTSYSFNDTEVLKIETDIKNKKLADCSAYDPIARPDLFVFSNILKEKSRSIDRTISGSPTVQYDSSKHSYTYILKYYGSVGVKFSIYLVSASTVSQIGQELTQGITFDWDFRSQATNQPLSPGVGRDSVPYGYKLPKELLLKLPTY